MRRAVMHCLPILVERDLDKMELALYGNIKREHLHCRCPSIMEQWDGWVATLGKVIPSKNKQIPQCSGNIA